MANIWNNDELAILMKEFISLHGRTEIIVAKLADILLEYFENANSFERSREDIIKFIQLHLAEEDQNFFKKHLHCREVKITSKRGLRDWH